MSSSLSFTSSTKVSPTNFDRILQKHHSDLRQCLSLQELIPLLRSHDLLTKEEWEEMLCKQTQQRQIDYLVQLLPRKGEQAYEKFVTCLESEKEHLPHMELAVKTKKTAEEMQKPNLAQGMDMVVEQVTQALKSSVSRYVQNLEDKITSLEKQLQEKDKIMAEAQTNCSHVSVEVLKFQKLLEYSNGLHGSQHSLDINTQVMAKYYHDTRNILRRVKVHLNQDADYIRRNIDTASEESDRSRTSSLDSQFNRPMYKLSLPRSPLSSKNLQESVFVKPAATKKPSTSDSSANEADDEHLKTQVAEPDQPDQEDQIILQTNTALLSSAKQQRPESWPEYKKKRCAKTGSHHSESDASHHNREEEELCYTQGVTFAVPIPEEDTSLASANNHPSNDVDEISLDHEESSGSIFEGYLQKEEKGELSKKRYFTLTKEFLFYSKSQQDTRPLGMIPLIDLKLDMHRKKKNTFEVINKRASLVKVKKLTKKNVQCYRAIRLKASNETEMVNWIRKIEESIRDLRTQYHT